MSSLPGGRIRRMGARTKLAMRSTKPEGDQHANKPGADVGILRPYGGDCTLGSSKQLPGFVLVTPPDQQPDAGGRAQAWPKASSIVRADDRVQFMTFEQGPSHFGFVP